MNTQRDRAEVADLTHCQRIAAGGAAGLASNGMSAGLTRYAARGAAFDVSITALRHGEQIEAAAGTSGEEVAAILEGTFTINAADEAYRLSAGEGIIIAPGEPRVWVCTSERGVLYRVVTHALAGTVAEAESSSESSSEAGTPAPITSSPMGGGVAHAQQ
jgi:quercetin dioxygenase-like cupin family protein